MQAFSIRSFVNFFTATFLWNFFYITIFLDFLGLILISNTVLKFLISVKTISKFRYLLRDTTVHASNEFRIRSFFKKYVSLRQPTYEISSIAIFLVFRRLILISDAILKFLIFVKTISKFWYLLRDTNVHASNEFHKYSIFF